MTKLPIKKRIRYKKQMLVTKYLLDKANCDYIWFVSKLASKYVLMKHLISNIRTELRPRGLLQWFSDIDCPRFLLPSGIF